MIFRSILVALLLFLPACKGQASTEEGPLRFALNVYDVVEGERRLGAASLSQLVIENCGSEEIRLATGGNDSWMLHSPYWELHIDGPVAPECVFTDFSPGSGNLLGQVPSVDIPANSARRYQLLLSGVCDPGVYRVSVKYFGTRVPHEVCYRKDVESAVAVFEIREAQGIDAEIIDRWSSQHPSKPRGLFPRGGMEPNIVNREVLLAHYPTSTYAAWALGIHPGAKLTYASAEEMFEDLQKPHLERKGRRGQGGEDPEGNPIWITPEEEAERYVRLAGPFLIEHEDHVLAPGIFMRLALAHLVLHQWQQAHDAMERYLASPQPFSRTSRCGLATKDDRERRRRELTIDIVETLKRKGLADDDD